MRTYSDTAPAVRTEYKKIIELLTQALTGIGTALSSLSQGLREHLGLSVIVSLGAIGFAIYWDTASQQIADLQNRLEVERARVVETLQDSDRILNELLPSDLKAPLLTSPRNNAVLVGNSVTLEWQNRNDRPGYDYLVEVRRIDNLPVPPGDERPFLATTPHLKATRFPPLHKDKIDPGIYAWRVVEGSIVNGVKHLDGNWSGYYVFQIASNTLERIRATKTLLAGVHYSHESTYMARDASGNPMGKDYDLIKKIAKELGHLPEINVPDLKVVEVPYPNVDALLLSGLRHGEVDIGVGEITRTRQRERRGILFTGSYVSTPLVLLGNEGMRRGLHENDRLGVIRGTTYARAAESMSLKRHITIIEDDSLGHLLRRLDSGDVHFILLDRTVAQPWHQSGEYKIVEPEDSLLADYYKKEYADEYAIATKDKALCTLVNSVMDKGEVGRFIAENYPTFTSKAEIPCKKVE